MDLQTQMKAEVARVAAQQVVLEDVRLVCLAGDTVTAADVDAVRFAQTLRGYKTSEVDWVLDRLGQELDSLRGELAMLRATGDTVDVERR